MPRVIITTCGTSLLTSNCWRGISDTSSILSPDLKNDPAKRAELEKSYTEYTQDYLKTTKPKELARQFDINVWRDTNDILKLPAELASLRAMQLFLTHKKITLTKNDRLILLCSDTEEGKFCAKVLWYVLKKHKLLEPICIPKPRTILKLDPARPNDFQKAVRKLWSNPPIKINDENNKYYFNITGGYKVTGALLTGFAYFLGSRRAYLFYLNEASYKEILVMGFDPLHSVPFGGRRLKIGTIITEPTIIFKGESLVPTEIWTT